MRGLYLGKSGNITLKLSFPCPSHYYTFSLFQPLFSKGALGWAVFDLNVIAA